MRPLKLHFPDEALPTLETCLKQTKEARLFRRAQAVRAVVHGHRLQTVSDALRFTYAALRQGGQRCAHQGGQGLVDRPRQTGVQLSRESVRAVLKKRRQLPPSHGTAPSHSR